jgi:hypothetical protein
MYYVAPFTFNFDTSVIAVDSGESEVDVNALYDAIKEAQASAEGILYGKLATGSGLVALGDGVAVGITVELLGSWQLQFAEGAYIARVAGGNLVGGPDGDPIAYSAGVQTLLIQSAASTVVTAGGGSGGGLTADQAAMLTALAKIHGLVLGAPLTVTPTSRSAGGITQTINESGGNVTVTRAA